jgi:hypothetical protein
VTDFAEMIVPNNWYHITVVRKENNFTLYVNGKPWETYGGEDYWTHNLNKTLVIGGRSRDNIIEYPFLGSLSDFRVYATALSQESIERLYSTPINIMKNAHLIASEFIEEENEENSFNRTGIVSSDSFATMTSIHHMPIQ